MKKSAGILLFRINNRKLEVFLVHPGGPFWKGKDAGTWSIPKGEYGENEDALSAAIREFEEETGTKPSGNFIPLIPVKQKAGNMVDAWAVKGDLDADTIHSNMFRMEWPPKSGKWQEFPEADKGAWLGLEEAREKINQAQAAFLDDLVQKISIG